MPDIEITLPTLHEDQIRAYEIEARYKAIRCGRRWGKTTYGQTLAADSAISGMLVGWFAPKYKFLSEAYTELYDMLEPVIKHASKNDGVMRLVGGGRIDFWTLDDEGAGRSRKYHLVIIDEGAFAGNKMLNIWSQAIQPTLLDYRGSALVLSNTNGNAPDNFLYAICTDPKHGFVEYHAPSHNNPMLPRDELQLREATTHPLVWAQEYLAEFVDWAGVAFFARDKLLVDGEPVDMPDLVDVVFATIDTATKTKLEHDGTGVAYWALTQHKDIPLILLDWDIQQIEGSLLEAWLPNVFRNLEYLARQVRARMGSVGAHIEDKNSGTILIQQAMRRGWPAQAIESTLTSVGKDERAISVSGYVYRGYVKIARPAYDKITTYKERTLNHLLSQVLGYRIGANEKDAEDDLLDAFCYGIAIALGNSEGF